MSSTSQRTAALGRRWSSAPGAALALAAIATWLAGLWLPWLGAADRWLTWLAFGAVCGLSVRLNGVIGETVARHKELRRDLAKAATVQRSLLPVSVPDISGADFAMVCRMSRDIGGDCVDIVASPAGGFTLLVGDVSGKGVSAALLMSSVQAAFRTLAQLGIPVATIASRLDRQLIEQGSGLYATAVLITVDPIEGACRYINAGHLPMMVLDATGLQTFDSNGPPLGLLPDVSRADTEVTLALPARLVVVTDGVTERKGPEGEYGLERLTALLSRVGTLGARGTVDEILAANDEFARRDADDDLTIVAVRVGG